MTWQPISTAPKDGTWIIVYLASWRIPPSKMSIVHWLTMKEGEGWHDVEEDEGPILSPVTHWIALPEPPTE